MSAARGLSKIAARRSPALHRIGKAAPTGGRAACPAPSCALVLGSTRAAAVSDKRIFQGVRRAGLHLASGPFCGSILILALWTLMVLGFLALAVGGYVSANVRLARYLQEDAVAYAQAKSGVALAVASTNLYAMDDKGVQEYGPELRARFAENASVPGGSFTVYCTFAYTNDDGGLAIVTNFGLIPENRKIRISDSGTANSYPLLAVVLNDESLTDAILVEYPSNKYKRVVGEASEGENSVAKRWYDKYGLYEAVPELMAVPGMDLERFQMLEPLVTIRKFRYWFDVTREPAQRTYDWDSFGGISEGRAWITGPDGRTTVAATRRISFVFGSGSNTVTGTLTNKMLYWREH